MSLSVSIQEVTLVEQHPSLVQRLWPRERDRDSWCTLTSIHLYAVYIDCGGAMRGGEVRKSPEKESHWDWTNNSPKVPHRMCGSHSVITGLLSFSCNKRAHDMQALRTISAL